MFWVSGEDVSPWYSRHTRLEGDPGGRPITLCLDYISQLPLECLVFSGGAGGGNWGKDGPGSPTDIMGENEHDGTYIMFNVLIYVIWIFRL